MKAESFNDKRILIIEDQRPFLILLKGLMSGLGATSVSTSSTAEQAAVLCRKNAFDMVVCDLHLGTKGKNGFELVEELRTNKWIKPNSIFLIISADTARPVVMGSVERRPDDFLVKPFSQAQIKSRLLRAWQKRQFLAPIYVAIEKQQYTQAIDIAKELMQTPSPYQRHCFQILVELFWKTKQADKALQLLTADKKAMQAIWTKIAVGRSYLELEQYEKALSCAENLIKKNKFCVEAHDILAESQSALKQDEQALETIQQALKISPYNLQRQFVASRIARQYGDFELASKTSLSIWEQSKRTVHQSAAHWCGYVRSLLDAAEHSEEKKGKNRFQQEALLAMQRGKHDDVLMRMSDSFDLGIFEHLINARINAIDGKLIDAKRILAQSQITIEGRFEEFPAVYAADSVHTLLQIGEFEQGQQLLNRLTNEKTDIDPNGLDAIERAKKEAKDRQQSYGALNKQGIELYQQGKFFEAKEIFHSAQKIVPVNTGVALNLLQCILKLIDQSKNKVDAKLLTECRQVYRIIDGIPLVNQHQEKFDALSDELNEFLSQGDAQ